MAKLSSATDRCDTVPGGSPGFAPVAAAVPALEVLRRAEHLQPARRGDPHLGGRPRRSGLAWMCRPHRCHVTCTRAQAGLAPTAPSAAPIALPAPLTPPPAPPTSTTTAEPVATVDGAKLDASGESVLNILQPLPCRQSGCARNQRIAGPSLTARAKASISCAHAGSE